MSICLQNTHACMNIPKRYMHTIRKCILFGVCVYGRNIFMHACMYMRTYVCMYACMYISEYVCMHVGMYTWERASERETRSHRHRYNVTSPSRRVYSCAPHACAPPHSSPLSPSSSIHSIQQIPAATHQKRDVTDGRYFFWEKSRWCQQVLVHGQWTRAECMIVHGHNNALGRRALIYVMHSSGAPSLLQAVWFQRCRLCFFLKDLGCHPLQRQI
jgi:hypothetical protein